MLLALVNSVTAPVIEANEKAATLVAYVEVLPTVSDATELEEITGYTTAGITGAVRAPDGSIALQASMVASVSADSRQFVSCERPSAIEARNTARCVWLLDGGGDILPDISPPRNAMLVIRRTSWLS